MMEDYPHDAFVSYPSNLRRTAVRLRRDLHAIARGHPELSPPDVFLDVDALRPGSLETELLNEVGSSRYLIVVIGPEAGTRPWVAREIEHWQRNGGSPDRLVLVEADPRLPLVWRPGGRIEPDSHVPPPLVDYFDAEQKTIRYRSRTILRQTDDLVGLCADLMNADTEDFLLAETRAQKKRTRIVSAVAVGTTIALIAAVISAFLAVRFGNEAQVNADRATAQADAAEALLAGTDSPTVGIQRVLTAAQRADSPTVRSAMLAVSQSTRRLEHAVTFPENETGHRVDGAGFSLDGATLFAWGEGREEGTSMLRVWEVASGGVEATAVVAASRLTTPAWVSPGRIAACSDAGPVVIEFRSGVVARLDDGWPGGRCEVHQYAGGVLVLGVPVTGGGSALSLDRTGATTRVEGVDAAAANPSSRSAVATGPSSVFTLVDGRPERIADAMGTARFADDTGSFLVVSGRQWVVVSADRRGVTDRTLVPEDATAVAPVLRYGRLTGALAWIKPDGTVGWNRDARSVAVSRGTDVDADMRYGPTLEPVGDGSLVAIIGNTATVVGAPTDPREPTPGAPNNWRTTRPEINVGTPPTAGADPVVARCPTHMGVLLASATGTGAQYVDGGTSEPRLVEASGRFTTSCDALIADSRVTLVPRYPSDPTVVVRPTVAIDDAVLSPAGDRVALVKTGFPIEILSTLPEEDLPRAWDVSPGPGSRSATVVALGEQTVFTELGRLLFTPADGPITRVPIAVGSELLSARPDGRGAVVAEPVTGKIVLVGLDGAADGSEACRGGQVVHLPAPQFRTSVEAAEAQRPSLRRGIGTVDCSNGHASAVPDDTSILDYQIGGSTGRIVSASDGLISVTTWERGDPRSIRTVAGPPTQSPAGLVSFDESADNAVTYGPGERRLTFHRRIQDGWSITQAMTTNLYDVATAQIVDAGTLVLVVGSTGGFELFDSATGRLVASDLTLEPIGGEPPISKITTRRSGDSLVVDMLSTGGQSATLRIPIGTGALRQQLCALYRDVPQCAGW